MSSQTVGRSPLTLTTGRWICRPCMQRGRYTYSATGLNGCIACGRRHWWPEWDPEALAEASRRGERK